MRKNINWSNHLLKLFAVLIGSTLWFYVLNSEPVTIQKEFELRFILPNKTALLDIKLNKVTVKMKGARTFVDTLLGQESILFIDLTDYNLPLKKDFSYFIKHNDVPVPFNIKVLDISPAKVSMRFDKKISKSLLVKPKFVGELSRGLQLAQYNVEPKSILVEGPRTLLAKMEILESAPIDLSKLNKSGKTGLSFPKLDEKMHIRSGPEVMLNYELKSIESNMTLKNIQISFLSSTQNFIPLSRNVAIDVLVSKEGAENIKASDVKVIAEVPSDFQGTTEVKLRAQLPEGVHLQKIHPSVVKIRKK